MQQTNKGMLNLCTPHQLKSKLVEFFTCSCGKTTLLSSTKEISGTKAVSMLETFKQLLWPCKVT